MNIWVFIAWCVALAFLAAFLMNLGVVLIKIFVRKLFEYKMGVKLK